MRLAICAGCLLQILAIPLLAQRPKVTIYTPSDGLPSAIIYDLAQDPSGRLWILSRGGVSVYDGLTFEHLSEGLPQLALGALDIDDAGRPWTVSLENRRPYVFDGSVWQPLPEVYLADRENDWATELATIGGRGDTRVVVGTTGGGLLVWDSGRWHRLDTDAGLPADRVNDLAAWQDQLYVATDGGPCVLSGLELDCRLRNLDPRLGERIFAVLPTATSEKQGAEPDRLWVLGNHWMGFVASDALTILADGLELRAYDFSILGEIGLDEAGGVFFGSPSELYQLDPQWTELRKMGPSQGLAANGATALLRDREANLWIGSLRGLTKITSQRFASYGQQQGLLDSEVSAIAEISPGRMIFGHDGGLSFLEDGRVETLAFPRQEDVIPAVGLPAMRSPLPGTSFVGRQLAHRVLDIAIDRRGEIWLAGHDLGLVKVTAERKLHIEPLEGRFYSVEIDARGELWATSQRRLWRRTAAGFIEVETGFEYDEVGFYRWLHAGDDGVLYIGARWGLLSQTEDGWKVARGPSDQASNIYNLLAESDGNVWAATGAGLFRLENDRLVPADLGGQTVNRPVYLLLRDLRGWLWIGTDDGVLVWDQKRLRQLTIRHGLAGRETNRGAGFIDHQGRIWIGTEQGASVYREMYDVHPTSPPEVELRAIEVDGRAKPTDAELELDHDQNQLLFHVATVGFDDEEAVRLRYRLDGLDDAWRGLPETVSSEILYPNLAPGSYTLRVAAARGEGPWSSEARSGTITIARPYWRTPWFFLMISAAISLAVGGTHLARVRAIRQRAAELAILNRRLLEEIAVRRRAESERELLIDDLQTKNRELERFTYTVSHDLKTPLVTINGFLGLLRQDADSGDASRFDRDLEHIETAVKKMGRLLEELLQLSRLGRTSPERQSVNLGTVAREAVGMLSAAIAERGITVRIADDMPVVEGDPTRLLEVLQNLVENAVKFLGDQSAPKIEIGVRRRDEGGDVILVSDNGIGIEPQYHEKVFGLFDRLDPQVEGTGVGLAIVRRIVELHGGKVWVESAGRGHGTTFCFTLAESEA